MRSSAWLLVLLAAGCSSKNRGGGGDGGTISGLTAITVTPANQTLTFDGSTAVTSNYSATGTFSDGHSQDVTQLVYFYLSGNTTIGSFTGNKFTSGGTVGGTTTVVAQAGTISGTTSLNVLLQTSESDPASTGLPASPASLFNGPTSTANLPDLVYPNDGVLLPPNLGKLEIHFVPGSGNTVFELSFENAVTDIKIYMTCAMPLNGGCIYQPDATAWHWVAETNRGGAPVTLKVRATDNAGSKVASSTTLNISFSQDDINGGIYYWTTANGTSIMRYDFASTTQTAADKYLGTTLTGGTCVGCHALSHDGTKMVMEAGGQNDGRILTLIDVGTRNPLVPFGSTGASNFESWNPDGSKFVGVWRSDSSSHATDEGKRGLMLFDGSTAAFISEITGHRHHRASRRSSRLVARRKKHRLHAKSGSLCDTLQKHVQRRSCKWSPLATAARLGARLRSCCRRFQRTRRVTTRRSHRIRASSCTTKLRAPTARATLIRRRRSRSCRRWRAQPRSRSPMRTRAGQERRHDHSTHQHVPEVESVSLSNFRPAETNSSPHVADILVDATEWLCAKTPPGTTLPTARWIWMSAINSDEVKKGNEFDPSYAAFARCRFRT